MVKKIKLKKKADNRDNSLPKNADFLMSVIEQDLKKRTSPKIAAKKNVGIKEKKHATVQEQPMNTVASKPEESSPTQLMQDEETDLFSW